MKIMHSLIKTTRAVEIKTLCIYTSPKQFKLVSVWDLYEAELDKLKPTFLCNFLSVTSS